MSMDTHTREPAEVASSGASPHNGKRWRRDLWLRVAVALALIYLGVLLLDLLMHPWAPGIGLGGSPLFRLGIGLLVGPGTVAVGALISRRVPGNVVGPLLVLWGVGMASWSLRADPGSPELSSLGALSAYLCFFGVGGTALVCLLACFPDGHAYPPWARLLVPAYALVQVAGVLLEVLSYRPGDEPRGQISDLVTANPVLVEPLASYHQVVAATVGGDGVLPNLAMLAALVSLFLRYRASGPIERDQIKWLAWAAVLGVSLFAVLLVARSSLTPGTPPEVALRLFSYAWFGSFPAVAIGIAILRHRLWDIDFVINRTLVYSALIAFVVGSYALVVGGLGALLRARNDVLTSILAAGLIAVLFAPVHERLRRAVNHLMYGERDDPYAALSRLGRRLESTLAPGAALQTVAETVATALKLPYAAVELRRHEVTSVAAEHGTPPDWEVEVVPLAYQGEPVGRLVVGRRAPEEEFSSADRSLLGDLARQAGVAAHAALLAADLQSSREKLVSAREEERRRLRRDLHDGLGPLLAAQTLRAGSARSLYPRDPAAADALLAELEEDLEGAMSEVRRLVYGLRPPALDDLGLSGAVRDLVARRARNGLRIQVEAPEDLSGLPAAVEAAAYLIAQEAVANVARHAHATCCVVRISRSKALELEIEDDGEGLPERRTSGVGLQSMRERAEELGGSCEIGSGDAGGTRVLVCLPLLPVEETS